jgi:two-component system, NtrC family, response regulator GlrR
MSFSHSATVLLRGFAPASRSLIELKTILQEAQIEVLVSNEPMSRCDKQKLPKTLTAPPAQLIIQALDQQLRDENQPLGRFLSSLPLETPVILSAHDFQAEEIRTMLELGATDFITPPFSAVSILPRVWRLLRNNASKALGPATLEEKMAMQRLGLIGQSAVFLEQIKKLRLLARCDITVMIGGETGTGKELVARAVHYLSPRCNRPFVPVDCGAIPPELTESELFGHARGAFTGAVAKNAGLVSAADQGTLFLDEVDALNLTVQAKLLRFLQEMEYRPIGTNEIKKADVRVISATNRDLLERVRTNEFRKDLYYRLDVVQLHLPSLRQRREDIMLLAEHFVTKYVARFNQSPREFSPDAIQKLVTYHWPGNIRELENAVGAAVALSDGPLICANDLLLAEHQPQFAVSFREAKARMIAEFERDYIVGLLKSCHGNVSEAARAAAKNRRAFWELIRKYRIDVRGVCNSSEQELSRKGDIRPRGFATG